MRNLMKSRFTPIAVVAVLLASVASRSVELPTISIIDSDTAPITVDHNRLPREHPVLPGSFPRADHHELFRALADFGPIGLVLTDGGGISDVLTVVVTDSILTCSSTPDTARDADAPPGTHSA